MNTATNTLKKSSLRSTLRSVWRDQVAAQEALLTIHPDWY